MERVGHEHTVEVCERPRLPHEISAVRDDPHTFVFRRNCSECRGVDIYRVNDASRSEHARECERESTFSAPKIRPGRRPEPREAAVGEHRGRIVCAHDVANALTRSPYLGC
jgi:hypothetical protein